MKRADNSVKATRNLDLLISGSEVEILSTRELKCVRGGDGEGNSGEPIIIIPVLG